MRLLIYSVFFFCFLCGVIPVHADETGFRFPSTCETNGDSCESMRDQDALYNSWKDFAYPQVIRGTFENFGVPDNAIIDQIQIKLRVRSQNNNRSWYALLFKDSIEYSSASCGELPCQYIQTTAFNSISLPTFAWYPNGDSLGRDKIKGIDLKNSEVGIKIYQSLPTDAADVDTIAFNIQYHLENVTPTPEPFLDLPWDYKSQGKTFEDIIYNPNSWFDHKYPLQDVFCCVQQVLRYDGKEAVAYYRSHSGYDYGLRHGVAFNTPVLAAAEGYATFVHKSHSGGAGNVIKIDHGNGYQTWYEHLVDDASISTIEGEKIYVQKGQEIGKTGFTGNVSPQGAGGAHIHFSVFKDANENNSFADDYPYGLVDPLGWEGEYPDPWTEYGSSKHGASSYNLFLDRAKPKEQSISKTVGGELEIENRVVVHADSETLPLDFTIKFADGPFITEGSRSSIVPSFSLNAFTSLGEQITQFYKPLRIVYRYTAADVLNIKQNTLLLYYLNELTDTWEPLPSFVNSTDRTVTAETSHFSQFALMGEIKDAVAPITQVVFIGDKGKADSYHSPVSIALSTKDNAEGVGVKNTFYKLDEQEWQIYNVPFTVSANGTHKIAYLSVDEVGNEESLQIKYFTIDTIPPEASIMYDIANRKLLITGKDEPEIISNEKKLSPLKYNVTIADAAGNTTQLEVDKIILSNQTSVSLHSIKYNNAPPIKFESNLFFTSITTKGNKIKSFDQYLLIKNDKQLYSKYIDSQGKTEVYIKAAGGSFKKENRLGIVSLQIFTQNGRLKYTF